MRIEVFPKSGKKYFMPIKDDNALKASEVMLKKLQAAGVVSTWKIHKK